MSLKGNYFGVLRLTRVMAEVGMEIEWKGNVGIGPYREERGVVEPKFRFSACRQFVHQLLSDFMHGSNCKHGWPVRLRQGCESLSLAAKILGAHLALHLAGCCADRRCFLCAPWESLAGAIWLLGEYHGRPPLCRPGA